jgi:hypothetical protein
MEGKRSGRTSVENNCGLQSGPTNGSGVSRSKRRKPAIPPIVAVGDFETDPFKYGRTPEPFACGFMYEIPGVERIYTSFWGRDCVLQFLQHIATIEVPLLIYFHNGGKFDFFFFLKHLENPLKIIHGRIVKAKIGIHEFRDSWAIIPMPLAGYAKTKIDYRRMEYEVRETHKAEILDYLFDDCRYLYDLVSAFVSRFGPRLTIAGTAQRELRKLHPQFNQGLEHDRKFRPFYFGGRVECFESGVIHGNFKVYDVNSMYPFVMRECHHPIGRGYVRPAVLEIDKEGWIRNFHGCFYFAVVRGHNRGALPTRVKDNNGGLAFDVPYGEFHTTSHELRLAIQLGLFDVEELVDVWIPRQTQCFKEFVDLYSNEKVIATKNMEKAKKEGDTVAYNRYAIDRLFSKTLPNASYGRFGINPFDFNDYHIQISGELRPENVDGKSEWEPYEKNSEFTIWRRKVNDEKDPDENMRGFEDVAIAASITSAARAVLMLAIPQARRPLYCDTDSIICAAASARARYGRRTAAPAIPPRRR